MSPAETVPFVAVQHLPLLEHWNVARELPPPILSRLPRIGLMAPSVRPCASGFLMQTDCSQAYIVELLSDPDVSEFVRGRALVGVVLGLLSIARTLGYESLRITTHWRGVSALARRLGGEVDPNLVVISSTSWVTE
jgi:hypothetical protein